MLIHKTNGKSFEPEITYVRDTGYHGGGGGIWALDQLGEMKKDLNDIARNGVANSVKLINKLCYQSSRYTPTLKSLALFSDIEDIVSERRKDATILPTNNPVMFGAMVYLETEKFLGGVDAEITYTEPSKFVGLEFGRKKVVNKSKLYVDYSHPYAKQYADNYEKVLTDIQKVCSKINLYMEWMTEDGMSDASEDLDEVVKNTLASYHRIIKGNVLIGITKPVIEDVWLNKRIDSSKELASMLISLYDYAEKRGLDYKEEYPNFDSGLAEKAMQEELSKFDDSVDYTLYSSIFYEIKDQTIETTAGRAYRLSYLIPTVVYANTLLKDLNRFHDNLANDTNLQSYYECKLLLERM